MVESKKTTAKKKTGDTSHQKSHHSKSEHDHSKKHHVKSEDSKAHTKKAKPHTSEHNKSSQAHSQSKVEKEYNPKILFTLLGVGVVIILALLLIFAYPDFLGSQGNNEQDSNNALPGNMSNIGNQDSDNNIVVTVNGEGVTSQEVSQIQQQLSSQGQQQVSRDQAIQQVITNTILLQETQGDVDSISDEVAEAELEEVLSSQGFTTQDLKDDLQEQGLSYEETLQDFKQRIAINRFLEQNINSSSVKVSDAEVEQAYSRYEQQLGNQTPAFEQIEQDIRNQLEQEKIQQLQSQFIEQLIEEANIEYN